MFQWDMWSWWLSLLGGVISSLLAIAVMEAYHWSRRRITHRPLRRLLGSTPRYGIVIPSYPATRREPDDLGLLTTDNAYALADVIESCRRIGIETSPVAVSAIPSGFPDNQILLGGHIANELTCDYLARFCPGFSPRGAPAEDSLERIWYECGGRQFIDTPDDAWSFVIKIGKNVTRQDRTLLLLFGRSSFGTTQAAHIVQARLPALSVNLKTSFALAARTSRRQGHHSFPDPPLDITTAAFASTP